MPTLSPLRLIARVAPHGLPLVRGAFHAGLASVFGPPPFDADQGRGDPGLFGPGSGTWDVVGEPAAIVGGLRALLLQLLHPHAMAGVADHSDYRHDALGRLQRTSVYVTATAFGSTQQALRVAATVRGVHRSVAGVAPDGQRYRADDPHLLTWVSIALTSSFLAAHRAYAPRPADRSTADRFVAEQSRAAALLDPRVDLARLRADDDAAAALRAGTLPLPMLEDGTLPTNLSGLEDTLAAYRPELEVNEQGREALKFLLWPELDPALKAAYLPLLGGALATLEPRDRELLGVPSPPLVPATVTVQVRAILAAFRLVGGSSPSRHAAERRLQATAA